MILIWPPDRLGEVGLGPADGAAGEADDDEEAPEAFGLAPP